nr:hypothetical protein [Tanacetum cinerariifolium]
MHFQNEMNRLQEMLNLRNSNQDPSVDLYDLKGSDKGDNEIDSLTKKPSDTLLMGDKVISTTPKTKNNKFIKSSVHDLVPILRESDMTSEFEDISSLDPPKSAPLNYEGNSDSMSRSIETSDLILEELTAEIGLDDSIPTEIDYGYYDSEGDILFLEHLLIEETFFDPTPAVLPKNFTLLVTPPLVSKQSSLREVERLDAFFSLTQSGRKTRVM